MAGYKRPRVIEFRDEAHQRKLMSRIVKAGIVQMANKLHGDESVEAHRKAMIEAHIPYINQAGEKGVQMLFFHVNSLKK